MKRRTLTIGELEKINRFYRPIRGFAYFIYKHISERLGIWLSLKIFDSWLKATGWK